MEEIDLKELAIFFKSKIAILVMIIVLICLGGCIYGLFLQIPMYSSYTTIVLGSNTDTDSSLTQSDINLNSSLIKTYAEVVTSKKVLTQVIDELNLDISYKDLADMISVSAVNNTEIMKIEVSSDNGSDSKKIADTVAKVFISEVSNLYNLENADILDAAEIPDEAYNINVPKLIVICFLIGIVLGVGILFVIFYFDRSIKTVEQVSRRIQLPILGTVQEYRESGDKK